MKRLLILIFAIVFSNLCCITLFAENGTLDSVSNPATVPCPIRIIYPAENIRLPALSSTYVGGSAPADGTLTVNGKPVPIHPGGGFLTMVNLSPGIFRIHAELQWGGRIYSATRTVQVAEPELPEPVSPLTIKYVTPLQDQELLSGDSVNITCKGSPGMEAYFTIQGITGKFPMFETKISSGMYQGVYRIDSQDKPDKSKISVTLVNSNNEQISKEACGRLSLFSEGFPVMAETVSMTTVLRVEPGAASTDQTGYTMYLPKETIVQLTGEKGNEYRVRLNQTRMAWVGSNHVKSLSKGILSNHMLVEDLMLNAESQSTIVRIPLARKIPFLIHPDADGRYIDILLFGAYFNSDSTLQAGTGIIKQLCCFQDDEATYRLRAYTMPGSWWGYDARYEGNQLTLELRAPKLLNPSKGPLEGLTVAVDAGHGSDGGAMGLTGFPEGEANLAMAIRLKEKLLSRGANVIMIRNDPLNVPLNRRTEIAWQGRADLLVSLHNNSLAPNGNPFQKRGYGVYYFTPMSLPLAKEIHTAYGEKFPPGGEYNLPDDGVIQSDLALVRAPQMPSVLIESAYMIVPEEEAYLKTDAFREVCTEAIVTGLERYVGRMRK